MSHFDEEDDELVDFLREYERYARSATGPIDHFDDWLEDNYGNSRKKVLKPSKKRKTTQADDKSAR